MKLTTWLVGAASALLLPAAANAHGTINPNAVRPGATQEFTILVPNERPHEQIVGVAVSVPSGATLLDAASGGHWRAKKRGATVTWRGGAIGPSRFDSFALRAAMPTETGTLTFRGRELYSDGTVEQFPLRVILAGDAHAAAPDDGAAHTVAVAALAVAIGAAILGAGAFFLALANWIRR